MGISISVTPGEYNLEMDEVVLCGLRERELSSRHSKVDRNKQLIFFAGL